MGRVAPAVAILIAIVAVAVTIGALSPEAPTETKTDTPIEQFLVNEPVKPITIKDKGGIDVTVDKSIADRTLVVFWDATCAECQTTLPMVASFVDAHPEIKPIYINVKNSPEQATAALKTMAVSIETYFDPTGSAQREWSGTMPAVYYIRDGSYRAFFPGRPGPEHLNALLALE